MLAAAVSSFGVWWTIDNQLLLTAFSDDALQLSSRQFSLAELGGLLIAADEPAIAASACAAGLPARAVRWLG